MTTQGTNDQTQGTNDQASSETAETPGGSILNETTGSNETGTGGGGVGDGTSGGDGNEGADASTDAIQAAVAAAMQGVVASLEDRLGERFDAVADRRVNAVLKEIRKGEKPGEGKETETPPAAEQPVGPDPQLLRGSRMVYREYIGDELKFVSDDERRLATTLADSMIREQVAGGADDEDRIGRQVSREIAVQLKAIRDSYERQIVDGLKRRGMLVETPGQPVSSVAGAAAGKKTVGSDFQAGALKAAEMFGTDQKTA